MSAPKGYSKTQITLHWVSAVLVIAVFISHDAMQAASKALRDGVWAGYDGAMLLHIIGGIAVFFFAMWRLGLLSRRGAPALPEGEPLPLRALAMLVKVLLYAIMILMPLSGAANWFGGVALAGQIHHLMEPLVPLTILLHVAGALYQQYWLKSGVLRRMMKPETD